MDNQQPRRPKRVSYSASNPRPNMFLRDGVWYFRKVVTTAEGRKTRKAVSTRQADYKLAEVAATEMESKANKGELDIFIEKKKAEAKPEAHYATFAQLYIDEVSVHKNNRNALNNDKGNLGHSIRFFGDRLLTELTAEDCEAFVRHARGVKSSKNVTYKANCIRNFVNATRMVFAYAIRKGLLARDPWEDVDRRKVIPRGTTRDRVLSVDEQEKFIEKADPESKRAFVVMLFTGVREDELLRLEPRHCDFANFSLKLTGDVVKGKFAYDQDPKVVVREIPMVPAVVQALQEQVEARTDGLGLYAKRRQGPWLWNMSNTTISERFIRISAAANIPHFTQHDCRRTFATRCAEAGVKPHKLQAWMGHADISTTMKFYVHEQRKESRDEMLRLDIGAPAAPVPIAMRRKTAGS